MVYLAGLCGAAMSCGLQAAAGDAVPPDGRVWVDVILSIVGSAILLSSAGRMARVGRILPPADPPGPAHPPEYVLIPLALFMMIHGAVGIALEGRVAEAVSAQVASGVAAVVVSAVIMLLCARERPDGVVRLLLGTAPVRTHVRLGVAGFLAAVPVCWAAVELSSYVLTALDPGTELPAHQVLDLLDNGGGPAWVPALLWANAVLSAPAVEELFFRGLCQPALGRVLGTRGRGVLATALIFGAVHATQPQAVLPMVLLGILLGWLYERTGGVLAPMVLHLCFNLKTMIMFSGQ